MFSLLKKNDGWCAVLWLLCLSFAAYAIWQAFPWLQKWAPSKSADLASWVQAVGSIAAIIFSGVYVRWQLEGDRKIEQEKIEYARSRKKLNLVSILEDELFYIEGNIKKYDRVFENRYQLEGARRSEGFFKPRPLTPHSVSEILSEYYSEFNRNQRLGLKTILTLYVHLNDYADKCEKHRKKRSNYKNYEMDKEKDFKNEVFFARNYISTGISYLDVIRKYLANEDVPLSAENDRSIRSRIHAEFGLKIDKDFLLDSQWKYDPLD